MTGTSVVDRTRATLRRALEVYADSPRATGWLRRHLDGLDEPLRLAVAGRVKAGKSTLLNALVGEEIAATDAGECTRVVTWYQDGPTPRVTLHPRDRTRPRSLRTRSGPGGRGLAIDLEGTPPETVDRLVVDWPSSGLRRASLIDTPGIASLSQDAASRASAFLHAEREPTPADAVLYLMRHLHSADAHFLDSFHDRHVARGTPLNTVAVLSRADEIGAGRDDAMGSARAIADRYRTDEKLATLCQTVVAVAGLLALTGRTLRSGECGALAALASLPPADTEALLLSADRFVTPPDSLRDRIPVEVHAQVDAPRRAELMGRFGVYGIRAGIASIRAGGGGPADPTRLATELVACSGLSELREVLASQFTERRDVLKARSALLALDVVLRHEPRPAAGPLATEVERIVAGAHEFAELHLLSGLHSRTVGLPADHRDEARRLVGGAGGAVAARLGLADDSDPATCREAAHEALARWRRRAVSPLRDRSATDAAHVVVRSCEGMLATLTAAAAGPTAVARPAAPPVGGGRHARR